VRAESATRPAAAIAAPETAPPSKVREAA